MFCSIKTNVAMFVFLTASSIANPIAVFAEDNATAESGNSTRIQIRRPGQDLPPLQATVSHDRDLGAINNDDAAKLRSIFAQQAGLKQAAFRGNAAKDDTNFRGQTPMLDRLSGKTENTNLRGQTQKQGPDNAPYLWCQSAYGGYYDCTGNYQGNVAGYRLRELGGKFVDGTPVPTGPVKMNEAGHVWYQDDLNHNSFRTMPGRGR